jgi:hypothetical protein
LHFATRSLTTDSAPATRMIIKSDGKVGIGVTSPSSILHLKTASSPKLILDNSDSSTDAVIDTWWAGTPLAFQIGSSEKVRIDSSGRLLVGTSTARNNFYGTTPDIQIERAADRTRQLLINNTNGSNASEFIIAKTRGTTVGSNTVVQDDDQLGIVHFAGADGTNLVIGASITALVDGTPGANDMPGRLVFSTTADGASSPTERMRITSGGNVGIGTTTVNNGVLHVKSNGTGSQSGLAVEASANDSFFSITNNGSTHTLGATYNSTGSYQPISFDINGEKARIDTSGRLLVGTSSSFDANCTLQAVGGNAAQFFRWGADGCNVYIGCARGTQGSPSTLNNGDIIGSLKFRGHDGSAYRDGASITAVVDATTGASDFPSRLEFSTTADGASSPTERMRITSAGAVGIGTTSPVIAGAGYNGLTVNGSTGGTIYLQGGGTSSGRLVATSTDFYIGTVQAGGNLIFQHQDGSYERARIDSSGRLLVGTSSSPSLTIGQYAKIHLVGNTADAAGDSVLNLGRGILASSGIAANTPLGILQFTDSAGAAHATIIGATDATTGSNDYPGRLVFSTTADGASSPTERMRINAGGNFLINQTTTDDPAGTNTQGLAFGSAGWISNCRDGATPVLIGRKGSDGTLVEFFQDGTVEGNISVSGTTVSYNGAHLSRWSQIPGIDPYNKAVRPEILRGSVLSNLDEMCEWGEEDNEQLNRMKVSDIEGDKNVSGVFQAWDDDDDTYINDFYCAMTGDFIIRIGDGVTVERGDLLMSAGNGTAKPQDDDIIRSKTIAKVTSTNVSCTYADGSYCVPCVLMAC